MNGLSAEQKQRMEEAGKDAVWINRLRTAETPEERDALLKEKGMLPPDDCKLTEEDLEKVSGGWIEGWDVCPEYFNYDKCVLYRCPHARMNAESKEEDFWKLYCDKGWGAAGINRRMISESSYSWLINRG